MSIFKKMSDDKLRDLDGRIPDPALDVKKDEELTIENAELALQHLLTATNSKMVDIVKVACGALRYYIETEELKLTSKIVMLPNDKEIIASYLDGKSINKTFINVLNKEE